MRRLRSRRRRGSVTASRGRSHARTRKRNHTPLLLAVRRGHPDAVRQSLPLAVMPTASEADLAALSLKDDDDNSTGGARHPGMRIGRRFRRGRGRGFGFGRGGLRGGPRYSMRRDGKAMGADAPDVDTAVATLEEALDMLGRCPVNTLQGLQQSLLVMAQTDPVLHSKIRAAMQEGVPLSRMGIKYESGSCSLCLFFLCVSFSVGVAALYCCVNFTIIGFIFHVPPLFMQVPCAYTLGLGDAENAAGLIS